MARPDVVAGFSQLFEGRHDAYGTEGGGCYRPEAFDRSDWPINVQAHLDGSLEPIGVYPMVPFKQLPVDAKGEPWHVKWGCVDFDIRSEHKGTNQSCDFETEGALAAG